MTREKLAEIKALAEKATPGPWFHTQVEYGKSTLVASGENDERSSTVSTDPNNPGWNTDGGYPGYSPSQTNCAYIAALSPDVALELVAEVERLRQKNSALLYTIEKLTGATGYE